MLHAAEKAPLKVFLVEDSPLLVDRLRAMLASIEGVSQVGHSASAGNALPRILAERPDVVVLDIKLRQGTGFDVLRALHQVAPEIAVFMLSNFATEPYRRLAAELGAQDFFDKTNELDAMRAAIAERAAAVYC
jgi:DNA-binding NarL/FixJ family response regulator